MEQQDIRKLYDIAKEKDDDFKLIINILNTCKKKMIILNKDLQHENRAAWNYINNNVHGGGGGGAYYIEDANGLPGVFNKN